jgi:hypothetical protein
MNAPSHNSNGQEPVTEETFPDLYRERVQVFVRQQIVFDLIGMALVVVGLVLFLLPPKHVSGSSNITDGCRAALAAANGDYANMPNKDACYSSSNTPAHTSNSMRTTGAILGAIGVITLGVSLSKDPRQMPFKNSNVPKEWAVPTIPDEDVKRHYLKYIKGKFKAKG